MKPHRATTILVLGILSLIVCAPLGLFAWIMGSNDLKAMDAGLMDPAGRSNTSAGRVCGMIGTLLLVAGVVIWVVIVLGFAGTAVLSGPGGR